VRLLATVVAALALAPSAHALDCPNVPLEERLAAADAAFVGRIVSSQPRRSDTSVAYRLLVDQRVKGPVGREVEVTAPTALVDDEDQPVVFDEAVGVLADLDGARLTTESCLLTNPGALLSVSDEVRGNAIKVVIGLAILALVLAYCVRRLRRRELPARSSLDR
jgi:hypothetical protein